MPLWARSSLCLGQKEPVFGPCLYAVDQGGQQQACGARRNRAEQKAPVPARPQVTTHPVAPRSVVTAKLSKCNVFSFITLSVSVLAVLLINPSLIRRRCQCANKISSFNIFLKCECFKENEGLVTPWLFLLSATHLPFGQSVPIEAHPSSPSTHSSLLAFPVLF